MAEPAAVRFQPTPNPNAGKFVTGRPVTDGGPRSFFSVEQATDVPVAEALLRLEGVESVFMVADFITVTKSASAAWEELAPRVEAVMRERLA